MHHSDSKVKIAYNNNISPAGGHEHDSISPKFSAQAKDQPPSFFGSEAITKDNTKKVSFLISFNTDQKAESEAEFTRKVPGYK